MSNKKRRAHKMHPNKKPAGSGAYIFKCTPKPSNAQYYQWSSFGKRYYWENKINLGPTDDYGRF